jgi:hypothetical protein
MIGASLERTSVQGRPWNLLLGKMVASYSYTFIRYGTYALSLDGLAMAIQSQYFPNWKK